MTAPRISLVALRTLPAFAGLDDSRLEVVARIAHLRNVPRGKIVLSAGEGTDYVYFVLNGMLRVLVSDDEGREVILSMLAAGDLFGEMGAIDDHPRSATVVAVQSSDLVVIAKDDFKRTLAENFEISIQIMRSLVHRLRAANRSIESLALFDVYGRVARLLLDMAEPQRADGKRVTCKLAKQDIAKMIGASREMVSRAIKDLQYRGLVEEDNGCFIIGELEVEDHGAAGT